MENSLVTYGFNKDREGIEQLGSVISVVWLISVYLFVLNSAQSSGNNWKFH